MDDLENNKIEEYFLFEGIKDLFIDDLTEIKIDSNRLFGKETNQKFHSIFKKISESDSNLSLPFKVVLSLKDEFIITNKLIGRFDTLKLIDSKRQKLLDFIDDYIEQYSENNLESENNYFSISKSIKIVTEQLKRYYKSYGPRFNIGSKIINNDKIRFFELFLYLQKKGFINITDCNYIKEDHVLNIIIDMKKSPKEIQHILGYWKSYGDLRINEVDGVVFYKGNKLPFSRTGTKEFKLLKLLMKNPGNKIPIDEIYSSIYKDQFNKRGKRKIVTELVTEVRKKLKINDNPNSTISLIVEGENVLLIANPP